jgi:hypothetical protein
LKIHNNYRYSQLPDPRQLLYYKQSFLLTCY